MAHFRRGSHEMFGFYSISTVLPASSGVTFSITQGSFLGNPTSQRIASRLPFLIICLRVPAWPPCRPVRTSSRRMPVCQRGIDMLCLSSPLPGGHLSGHSTGCVLLQTPFFHL